MKFVLRLSYRTRSRHSLRPRWETHATTNFEQINVLNTKEQSEASIRSTFKCWRLLDRVNCRIRTNFFNDVEFDRAQHTNWIFRQYIEATRPTIRKDRWRIVQMIRRSFGDREEELAWKSNSISTEFANFQCLKSYNLASTNDIWRNTKTRNRWVDVSWQYKASEIAGFVGMISIYCFEEKSWSTDCSDKNFIHKACLLNFATVLSFLNDISNISVHENEWIVVQCTASPRRLVRSNILRCATNIFNLFSFNKLCLSLSRKGFAVLTKVFRSPNFKKN